MSTDAKLMFLLKCVIQDWGSGCNGGPECPCSMGQLRKVVARHDAATYLATLTVDPPGEPDHNIEVERLLAGDGQETLKYARAAAERGTDQENAITIAMVDYAARMLELT